MCLYSWRIRVPDVYSLCPDGSNRQEYSNKLHHLHRGAQNEGPKRDHNHTRTQRNSKRRNINMQKQYKCTEGSWCVGLIGGDRATTMGFIHLFIIYWCHINLRSLINGIAENHVKVGIRINSEHGWKTKSQALLRRGTAYAFQQSFDKVLESTPRVL